VAGDERFDRIDDGRREPARVIDPGGVDAKMHAREVPDARADFRQRFIHRRIRGTGVE
jgi:hypothetical protein